MSGAAGTFVVTAAASGHGKTLVSLALCRAWRDRGLRVQPYKIGPDYIDARFYARVAGRPAYNVDLWLDGEAGVRAHVAATRGDANVALFEGMMGLYDGATDGTGTTADVARLLGARVVAVIDCWASSQTAAAVALGLRAFDPSLDLAGVVLNRVAGDDHERAVRAACAHANVAVLATVRYDVTYEAADRRLGLDVAAVARREAAVDALARELGANAPLVALFADAAAQQAGAAPSADGAGSAANAPRPRVAYAHDDAFWFTYPETLEALRLAGAEPVAFSPLHDRALPEGTRGVWIGGGYPESFAAELEANVRMRAALSHACASGMPAYAECGGLMYLAERLQTDAGTFAMVGALRGGTSLVAARLHIGYREARTLAATPLDPADAAVRGYEFHYASAALAEPAAAYAFDADARDGAVRNNVVAGFLHRHFLPGCAPVARFVAACAA
ncbi:MAG: cobyrinate a,c-diamide synthase [Vulcanimicrobiaceae bacterium]